MRAIRTLIVLAGLLAIAGVAAAQNAPCPECDADGGSDPLNSYHSVDVGVIEDDSTEVLGDTDAAYSHDGDERGFWAWLSVCLSVFVQHVEDALGVQTDADANVEVYADSEGVDVDAAVYGTQAYCDMIGVQEDCEPTFDESELGDADGMTYQAIADVEATTGQDVFVPAFLPDTGDSDTDACLYADLELGLCG